MFSIKQNDQRPFYRVPLTRGGEAVSLVGASGVTFQMRKRGSVENAVESSAIILDDANGIVEYRWAAGDTATEGVYFAEFSVTWPDSTEETYPTIGYEIVLITGSLD